jgi:hypothetical protein
MVRLQDTPSPRTISAMYSARQAPSPALPRSRHQGIQVEGHAPDQQPLVGQLRLGSLRVALPGFVGLAQVRRIGGDLLQLRPLGGTMPGDPDQRRRAGNAVEIRGVPQETPQLDEPI